MRSARALRGILIRQAAEPRRHRVKLWVGTSGYSYKEWKGPFYPEKIAPDAMLRFYGERLPAVEIDNTFYRLPRASVLVSWTEQVPADFRFSLKASRRITHFKRLKGPESEMEYLLRTVASLGERLGTILYQLPPNLPMDFPRLETFLALIGDRPATFEFRHPSWFTDEVMGLLRARRCALCLADAEDDEDSGAALPGEIVPTASWGYLRLRRPDYTDADLRDWIERIRSQPWAEAFVFFKHEDAGAGPRLAARFLELAGTGG
jgi:uncharacterized protein YecE (DUF72 family)